MGLLYHHPNSPAECVRLWIDTEIPQKPPSVVLLIHMITISLIYFNAIHWTFLFFDCFSKITSETCMVTYAKYVLDMEVSTLSSEDLDTLRCKEALCEAAF